MNCIIDLQRGNAVVTGAVHEDGSVYAMKYVRKFLQDTAKSHGAYGLTFYHDATAGGVLYFTVSDPYRLPGMRQSTKLIKG